MNCEFSRYLPQLTKQNTQIMCGKSSKLKIKISKRGQLMLFWSLHYQLWTHFKPCSSISTVEFEKVRDFTGFSQSFQNRKIKKSVSGLNIKQHQKCHTSKFSWNTPSVSVDNN